MKGYSEIRSRNCLLARENIQMISWHGISMSGDIEPWRKKYQKIYVNIGWDGWTIEINLRTKRKRINSICIWNDAVLPSTGQALYKYFSTVVRSPRTLNQTKKKKTDYSSLSDLADFRFSFHEFPIALETTTCRSSACVLNSIIVTIVTNEC